MAAFNEPTNENQPEHGDGAAAKPDNVTDLHKRVGSALEVPEVQDAMKGVSALLRIDPVATTMMKVVFREQTGSKYFRNVASFAFDRKTGKVKPGPGNDPELNEIVSKAADKIEAAWSQYRFPVPMPVVKRATLPEHLFDTSGRAVGKIDRFLDRSGEHLVMIEQRLEKGDGTKAFHAYTYCDDAQWRAMTPEKRPLWGLDQLKDGSPIVFVHEGVKAAEHVRKLVNPHTEAEKAALAKHPWGMELSAGSHLAWTGGAFAAEDNDWSELAKAGVIRVYLVADNDRPGRLALPQIAKQLRGIEVLSVKFTSDFTPSFDLANDFPEKLFEKDRYVGPPFLHCVWPATWATTVGKAEKGGKPPVFLREEFAEQWAYVAPLKLFVHKQSPQLRYGREVFNDVVSSFSDTKDTAALLIRNSERHVERLAYRPDKAPGAIVDDEGMPAINVHVPGSIRAAKKAGKKDFGPWLEYLAYMFPDEGDRHQVMRWCATMIARPGTRMTFSMLLFTEKQGVGKGFLAEHVLAPLVGLNNVSMPSESDLLNSAFNGWAAHKRLVIAAEIYGGANWKAYNRLKATLTDRYLWVNEKHEKPYRVENWAHVCASSNDDLALKIDHADRRWLVPQVTETPWPREEFERLHLWLRTGGLEFIRSWAEGFGDYVLPGEHAPMTMAKRRMIDDSQSDAAHMAEAEAVLLVEESSKGKDKAVLLKDVKPWIERRFVKVHESPLKLRRAMERGGMVWLGTVRPRENPRLKFGGQLTDVLLTPALAEKVRALGEDDKAVRALIEGVRWTLTRFESSAAGRTSKGARPEKFGVRIWSDFQVAPGLPLACIFALFEKRKDYFKDSSLYGRRGAIPALPKIVLKSELRTFPKYRKVLFLISTV